MFIGPWCAFLERGGRRPYRFVPTTSQFLPPKIVSLAGAESLARLSGSSLDEGQDIRNLHLPEVAAAPSNFVADLPRIAECRGPRSETTKLSSFSLFYDGRSRTALTRYRNCFSRLAFVNESSEESCLPKRNNQLHLAKIYQNNLSDFS